MESVRAQEVDTQGICTSVEKKVSRRYFLGIILNLATDIVTDTVTDMVRGSWIGRGRERDSVTWVMVTDTVTDSWIGMGRERDMVTWVTVTHMVTDMAIGMSTDTVNDTWIDKLSANLIIVRSILIMLRFREVDHTLTRRIRIIVVGEALGADTVIGEELHIIIPPQVPNR